MKTFFSFLNKNVGFVAARIRNLASRYLGQHQRLSNPMEIENATVNSGETPEEYIDEYNLVKLLIVAAVQACYNVAVQYGSSLGNGDFVKKVAKNDLDTVAQVIGAQGEDDLVQFQLQKEGVVKSLESLKEEAAKGEPFLCAKKSDVLVALEAIRLQTNHNFMNKTFASLPDGEGLREVAERELTEFCYLHRIPCRLTSHVHGRSGRINFSVIK